MAREVRQISDLNKKGEWVTLKVTVMQLWNNAADSISQVGLLGDETDKIKFVSWKKSRLPDLEEGKGYFISNAVVDSWNGKKQVNFNSRTKIKPIDEPVASIKDDNSIVGRITRIVPKSGYIERCPECNRVLVNDHCPVHIDVEPIEDLRVKAAIDADSSVFIANGKIAEDLLHLQLGQIKKMEKEDVDCLMDATLVGKKFRFKGNRLNSNFIVEDFEIVE